MPVIRRRRPRGEPAVSLPGGESAWVLPAWWDERGAAKGWVPLGLPDPDTPRWLVDPAGGVSPAGGSWTVEWWIGADDRWHVPSREGTARLRLVDGAPVVEARLHVPGGDVVLTEWAVPAGSRAGRVAVVIRNESTLPLAVAAVLRPWGPRGRAGLNRVVVAAGCIQAHAASHGPVRLESQEPAAHVALPGRPGPDSGAAVLANASRPAHDGEDTDPSGWANGALIWPLARQGTLRLQVTAGVAAAAPTSFEPEAAARAWRATVGRAVRLELPEGPLARAIAAQMPRLLLAAGWPGVDPRGEALAVDALGGAGFTAEAGAALDRLWPQGRSGFSGPARDIAAVLWAADRAGLALSPAMARTIGEGAETVARSLGRGGSPEDRAWARAGLRAAARLLSELDEDQAAATLSGWVERAGEQPQSEPALPVSGSVAGTLMAAASVARRGSDPTDLLAPLLGTGGAIWSWPGGGDPYDPLVAVGWWAVARSVLVDDGAHRLALFPTFPPSWEGQAVEVHGLPTVAGLASWALRWHGERPALLWDIEGEGAVSVSAPGLDPSWTAADRSGDALLRS